MAYPQTMSPQAAHQHYRDVNAAASSPPTQRLRQITKQQFVAELSQCLFDFVIQLLPTQEELSVKEDVRKLLERLIRTIEPDSRLLSFGSTANGFSLRNSDMDLCCLIDSPERLAASDLVTMLGDLLERETKFHVKPLPHARIPIVKLSLDPSPGLPTGIACDIGFENRLALENTRLLMCYAMIDPTRVRTMVLFLKVWSKRRKINSPYKGTLSSYGYVLLVIYFLVHVKNPPVLPNLQQMPPLRPIPKEETLLGGYNTWFFDDIDLLRQRWHSENTESVAELLIDFFRYFSRDFAYNGGVASIRAGLLKKESKGWQSSETSTSRYNDARERNRLCIEDPFETDYNVARCVTKDGLYTIRGEFMRASRVLATRPERAILALADLCEERKDEDLIIAPPYFAPSRQVPPQTPYSVGSRSMQSKTTPIIPSPTIKLHEPGPSLPSRQVPIRPPPEHMAPKRSQWTSPPPPEAPPSDHTLFESQLGAGLELATAATEAREKEETSSSSSEIIDDEDRRSEAAESDDVTSIRSFTEGTTSASAGPSFRRPSSGWLTQPNPDMRLAQAQIDLTNEPPSRFSPAPRNRPNRSEKGLDNSSASPIGFPPSKKLPTGHQRPLLKNHSPLALSIPLPPSPDVAGSQEEPATVYYQTRSPHSTYSYSPVGTQSPMFSYPYMNPQRYHAPVPHDIFPANLPTLSLPHKDAVGVVDIASPYPGLSSAQTTPTPTAVPVAAHNHSHSASTITASTPPPTATVYKKPSNLPSVLPSSYVSSTPPFRVSPSRSHYHPPSGSTPPSPANSSMPGKSPITGSSSPKSVSSPRIPPSARSTQRETTSGSEKRLTESTPSHDPPNGSDVIIESTIDTDNHLAIRTG
ncbi:hypothetical protein EV361DRAFT_277505 [Lentinula raphanica]|uniref:polynucleotide adenylyltransferase n=1 Tax=Lentinula raphanica TaxID=153919 RepID=A0AA38P819_9AGAR|nr:hypothetical protein F5880DRAFT_1488735 [Lentinula raphanica]KAJ3838057.1 hypothetical protein F5878DRAFT_188851 [Lentinula raphanica]KAJ3976548.1 hypothetical protein EV361DRAFT_277505 [Lentinula raphanica]